MLRAISTIPACLDALVAAATRALPNVMVVDGQPAIGQDADDIVLIGFTGEPGDTAVESTRSQQQGTTDPDRESYDITCLASSWAGSEDDPKVVRDRAYELVNGIAAELAAAPTLGGAVGRTRISTNAFAQGQTDRGAVAVVRFVVHVEAFTRRP
jgi:hypothetical protein